MTLNHEAIRKAYTNAFVIDDGAGVFDADGNQIELNQALVDAAATELAAERIATQYQRDRQPEYPSLAEFADAYYWSQKGDDTKMTAYVAACDAVKTKYPKPEAE